MDDKTWEVVRKLPGPPKGTQSADTWLDWLWCHHDLRRHGNCPINMYGRQPLGTAELLADAVEL